MYWIDPVYFWLVFIPVIILSVGVQIYLKRAYAKWGEVRNGSGQAGLQVAGILFAKTSLNPIPVARIAGDLTDHFDPANNTVGLSEGVYGRNSVAAMAITAHELGHVQQYQTGSGLIKARNFLLPALQFSPMISYIAIVMGLFFNLTNLFWIGVLFFAIMVLFSFLTLPVEIDASKRGTRLLQEAGLMQTEADEKGSKAVLRAAAMTYLAAAISSLLQLLYYISIAKRRS